MDKDKLSVIGAIALNDIFGQEPQIARHIIDSLGSTHAIFELPEKDISGLFGPFSKYRGKISRKCLDKAAETYDNLNSGGCSFLSICDKGYPQLLLDCPDAPVLLYVRSTTPADEIFNRRTAISIVGTRDISMYGSDLCVRTVGALGKSGNPPVIVSGLAIGVDVTAHLAALGHSMSTIGVSPVGIDGVYPRRHEIIAEKMAAAPGSAIITDYPPGTVPMPYVFLRRNRIIAGISSATILIESKVKGGGMMTARLAAGYGRRVFALPGRIDDARSAGCNLLIAENIAEPLISPENLPELLGLGSTRKNTEQPSEAVRREFSSQLDAEETNRIVGLYDMIRDTRGICYDELCSRTGLPYREIARLAGMLEGAGFIRTDMLQRCTTNSKFV